VSRLSPPTHDHLHIPKHELTALDYLEDNQYRKNIIKHGWDLEPAPFNADWQEQLPQTKSCPWCSEQHPYNFDTNQCPTRLERLRVMRPTGPQGPTPEPAPFPKAAAYPPIHRDELSSPTAVERGQAHAVSPEEFQQLAAEGHAKHRAMAENTAPTTGMDQNWDALKEHSWNEVQKPWGGATIDSHTGVPVQGNTNAYALTVKEPGYETHSIPIGSDRATFHAAMDQAKQKFQPLLERQQHHLGVFRDDDKGTVDFDPTIVTPNLRDVHTIGAYTRAVGGAYNFQNGNGYWPPYVDPQMSPPNPQQQQTDWGPDQQVQASWTPIVCKVCRGRSYSACPGCYK